jgi:hypothetical protein
MIIQIILAKLPVVVKCSLCLYGLLPGAGVTMPRALLLELPGIVTQPSAVRTEMRETVPLLGIV